MLEGGSGGEARGSLQLTHKLPAVQGIQEVDVAGAAVQNGHGKLGPLHEDPGRLLVRVASVLELDLAGHVVSSCRFMSMVAPVYAVGKSHPLLSPLRGNLSRVVQRKGNL